MEAAQNDEVGDIDEAIPIYEHKGAARAILVEERVTKTSSKWKICAKQAIENDARKKENFLNLQLAHSRSAKTGGEDRRFYPYTGLAVVPEKPVTVFCICHIYCTVSVSYTHLTLPTILLV